MQIEISWDTEFSDLMTNLHKKYGHDLFTLDGIGDQLDVHYFSKNFFNNSNATADVSIDANANVCGKTSIDYNYELPKPLKRFNSYFLLWKELKKSYGQDVANNIIEQQLTGTIYINDFTDIATPYSYDGGTTIIYKQGDEIFNSSLRVLFFKHYADVSILPDREEIDLRAYQYLVYEDGRWVQLERIVRHRTDKNLVFVETKAGTIFSVTEDHPCILADGSTKPAGELDCSDQILLAKEKFNCPARDINNNFTNKSAYDYGLHIGKQDSMYQNLPANFLMYPEEIRSNFLAGLIDSCGSINTETGLVTLEFDILELAQQAATLAESLSLYLVRTSFKTPPHFNNLGVPPRYNVTFGIATGCKLLEYSVKACEFKTLPSNYKNIYHALSTTFNTGTVFKVERINYSNFYVYDITTESGKFYTNGIIAHNCFNYSTYDIASNGLPGLSKRLKIQPPKSLDTFFRQVEQFIVVAANSTLGATGFADLFLVSARYVNKLLKTGWDGHISVNNPMTYIKEKITEFIYTVNWEFRGNQCVTEDTDVLTPSGFKNIDNLKIGDSIYIYNAGCLDIQKVERVNIYDYQGDLHEYAGEGISQVVTPNHRVAYLNSDWICELKESKDVLNSLDEVRIPIKALNEFKDYPVDPKALRNTIQGCADGVLRDIPEWVGHLSNNQAIAFIRDILNIFYRDITVLDALKTYRIKIHNNICRDLLQLVAFLAGYSLKHAEPSILHHDEYDLFKPFAHYYSAYSRNVIQDRKCRVWCPTTEHGVVIFRRKGRLFISGNSAFTNISLYDDGFLKSLCPDYGVDPEDVRLLQLIYVKVMNEEMERTPLTFPVTTACFCTDSNGEIKDKRFLRFIAENNKKYAFMNIYNGSTSTLSSCCFSGEHKILWRPKMSSSVKYWQTTNVSTFAELYEEKGSELIYVLNPLFGEDLSACWVPAHLIKLEYNKPLIRIALVNGGVLLCTPDHIHLTLAGEKTTNNLTEQDSLATWEEQGLRYTKIAYINTTHPEEYVYCVTCECEQFPYFCIYPFNREGQSAIITHNCRLRSNQDNPYFNSFGAGSTKIGCYDDKTEVLTNHGWKLFRDVDIENDLIFGMDDERNSFFEKATEYHEYDYSGTLLEFKSNVADLCVTPNHRMVVWHPKGNNIVFEQADYVYSRYEFHVPIHNPLVLNEVPTDFVLPPIQIKNRSYPEFRVPYITWAKFMGIYLSEGYCDKEGNHLNSGGGERYRIIISQSKEATPDNYALIENLLSDMGFVVYKTDMTLSFENKQICLYLRQFGTQEDRYVPEDLKNQSQDVLETFWLWLRVARSTDSEMYWSISKRLINDIQDIIARIGYTSYYRLEPIKNSYINCRHILLENQRQSYRLVLYRRRHMTFRQKDNYSSVNYSGKVYCLSVPHGRLFVRRNGFNVWSGNSLGVVTANLPRLAMQSDKNLDTFLSKVHDVFISQQRINACKRRLIKKRIELGAAPLYTHHYMELSKQYSTFGIVGVNEAVQLLGYDILEKSGQDLVLKLLKTLNEWCDRASEEEKAPQNLEQVPAESSAVKLAQKDKLLGYDCGVPFYSNQFIPLIAKADMQDRLRLQGLFDKHLSGGAIAHINVSSPIKDTQTLVSLMAYAAKCGCVYWAINYRLSCCEEKHTWVGSEKCPKCGKPCDSVITRVVGSENCPFIEQSI